MKRKLTNLENDLKIVVEELSDILILTNENGLGLYSRSWLQNFYEKTVIIYNESSDLEEVKTGVKELWYKLS
jgi:hypothetical protein